jgi:hypothetical protein
VIRRTAWLPASPTYMLPVIVSMTIPAGCRKRALVPVPPVPANDW